jgi:NADH-ubiquinone oxidoreductase chain 2
MVLSAALDNGYIFISLIAILTSVIGAVYYLNVIKEIFFQHSTPEYKILNEYSDFYNNNKDTINNISNTNTNTLVKNINISTISSPFSITISIITLVILLFIFMNREWLSMGTILVQVLFND